MEARRDWTVPFLYALYFLNFYIFIGALTVRREITLISDLLFGDSVLHGLQVLLVGLFRQSYLTVDAWLMAALVFIAITLAGLSRKLALLMLPVIALVFVLALTQFRYFTEVGSFYDSEQLAFGISHASGLMVIYKHSGASLAFKLGATGILLAILPFFLAPAWRRRMIWGLLLVSGAALASNISLGRSQEVFQSAPILSAMTSDLWSPQADLPVTTAHYSYDPVTVDAGHANGMNVVLIVLESARAKSVPGFSGSEGGALMPALADLGRESVLYDRAYTTMSHTSKALVGIICGTHPAPEARFVEYEPGRMPVNCLPALLGRAGYRSLYIQSAAGEFEARDQLTPRMGFDKSLYRADIQGQFRRAGYFGLDERALVKPIQDWWAGQAGQRKFLTVLTSISHHPYAMPGHEMGSSTDARASYLQVLGYTDGVIGSLIRFLRSQPEWDNTLVIVTGDHGEGFGEHPERVHDAVPYDEATRVPLMVRDPRQRLGRSGRLDQSLRQHTDILPTVLDALNLEYQARLPGISLRSAQGHDVVQTHCFWINSCLARREGNQKFIFFPARNELKLFDMGQDPAEQHDLSAGLSEAARAGAIARIQSFRSGLVRRYQQKPG